MAEFISEALGPAHVLSEFDSGQSALDVWLRKSSAHALAMRVAKTFVWHSGDRVVLAYFSLSAHLVVRHTLPKKLGRGAPDAVPAILLARLALHRAMQGQGLGGELLWDALKRARDASEIVAARLVVVDAIDRAAASFYQHHGFTTIPGNDYRLVQKLSDIASALD